MAKARTVELTGDMTFAQAAALAVSTRADELFAHGDDVLDTAEIERVHDMRVASRRLRAALEVFARCFERKAHRRALRDVKALADALGERRDPDVQLQRLEALRDDLGPSDRPGLEILAQAVRERQGEGNRVLADALAAVRSSDLHDRLRTLALR